MVSRFNVTSATVLAVALRLTLPPLLFSQTHVSAFTRALSPCMVGSVNVNSWHRVAEAQNRSGFLFPEPPSYYTWKRRKRRN